MPKVFESAHLTQLRVIHERFAQLVKEYNAAQKEIKTKPRLGINSTPEEQFRVREAINGELSATKNGYLARLEDLAREIEEYRVGALADIRRAIGRPAPKSTEESLLRELQEQRAWARAKPLLDRVEEMSVADKASAILKQALADGDDDTVWALRAEMPAYLTGRVTEDVAREYIPTALKGIDSIIGESRPELGSALAAQAEIERGGYNVGLAVSYTKSHIQEGETSGLIPGWSGEMQQLEIESASVSAGMGMIDR